LISFRRRRRSGNRELQCLIAAATKQIKLGTGTVNLPNAHPGAAASAIAMLDHMLDGRFASLQSADKGGLLHWISALQRQIQIQDVNARLAEDAKAAAGDVLPHKGAYLLRRRCACLCDSRHLQSSIGHADVWIEPRSRGGQHVRRDFGVGKLRLRFIKGLAIR
jgi:hypothetical protein